MSHHAAHPDALDDLLMAATGDAPTDADRAELWATLADGPEARRRYVDYLMLHAALAWERGRGTGATLVRPADRCEGDHGAPVAATAAPTHRRSWRMLAAACVLIGAVGAASLVKSWRTADVEPRPAHRGVVATVIDVAGVAWQSEPLAPGQEIDPQWLRTGGGRAEFMLGSGVALNVTGPAELALVDRMRVTLRHGRLSLSCPPSARGFAVELPGGARAIDRGTRFDAIADDAGDCEVHVIEGRVDLTHGGRTLTLSAAQGGGVIGGRLMRTGWPLIDGGFEAGEEPRLGWPTATGEWGGEPVRLVGAERGIRPAEGERMMRFVYADVRGAHRTSGAQMYQFIDLRPYADAIADRRIRVELSARFNRVAGDEKTDRRFLLALYPHRGPIASFQPPQRHPEDSTARLTSDGDPATWQPLSVTLTPTPGDDYAIVVLNAMEDAHNDLTGEEFHGHYADAVELRIIIDPQTGEGT